ncbi:MAG: HXXEE domain-containing protein [Acetobacter sp.]|nr:HXXEE domain-containing protein [Bacteroides sp.]MCM1340773.1 HXXEE domain-containing protein [Acetobacter sp.]MCM1432670.1 HXXEE domain-containing protein [Clostridiales bacterium]
MKNHTILIILTSKFPLYTLFGYNKAVWLIFNERFVAGKAMEIYMQKIFKFFLTNWVWLCAIALAAAVAVLIFRWDSLSILLRLNILSFIAINAHEVEEYGWPGGGPIMANDIQRGKKLPFNKEAFPANAPIDRYPLNQFSTMWGNCLVVFTVYLFPMIWPDKIALGIMPMIFGILQLPVHGGMSIMIRSPYNPGLLSVILLHIPIGIYYLHYVIANELAVSSTWIIAIAYLLFVMIFVVALPTYKFFPNMDTKWPFTNAQVKCYERIKKTFIK